MIDEQSNHKPAEFDDTEVAFDEISKSQRKRDADAVRDLGSRLAELSSSELSTIDLPEDVLAAIHEFKRIKSNSARKRQLGYMAKRMRQIDVEPIEAALEKLRQAARANTINLHLVENWRDRLLGEVQGESEKQALTAFLDAFAGADRQRLRHLQRQAISERQAKRPPAATRLLFKALRDIIIPTPGNE